MTTARYEKTKCSLCAHEDDFIVIDSTNTFGPPDLDTRPAPMKRATINSWVMRCTGCGYCANDISETPAPEAREAIADPEYIRQISGKYPDLANSFICQGMIARATKNELAEGWAWIHAAWACDDAGASEQATECRFEASRVLLAAEDPNASAEGQEGALTAVCVDLLRRAGRFDEAAKVLEASEKAFNEGRISKENIVPILALQETLIGNRDAERHTVDEAFEDEPDED